MKHHKIGDIVPLGGDIYMVQKVENGWVYLRQPNARGKQKRLYWREVPYFEDGKLVYQLLKNCLGLILRYTWVDSLRNIQVMIFKCQRNT